MIYNQWNIVGIFYIASSPFLSNFLVHEFSAAEDSWILCVVIHGGTFFR